jgi:HAD superfamily hydrolase (TIGR01549 family)
VAPGPGLRPIEIVFFDVGGTLLEVRQFDLWCELASNCGISVDVDHLAHASGEVTRETDAPGPAVPLAEFWRRILERSSGTAVELATAEQFLQALDRAPREARLFADARRCLDDVRALGLRTGVISNSRSEGSLRELLAHERVLDGLEPILSSGTEGIAKPSPELFARAAQRARVAPDRAFYVGDLAYTDAKASQAAGFHSVWLNREGTGFGEDPPEITSLTELPGYLQLVGLVPPAAASVK